VTLSISVAQSWIRSTGSDADVVSSGISVASGDVLVAVLSGGLIAPNYGIAFSGGGSLVGTYEAYNTVVAVQRFTSSATITVTGTALFFGFGDPALVVYKVTGAASSPVGGTATGQSTANAVNPAVTMVDAGGVLIAAGVMTNLAGAPTSSNLTTVLSGTASGTGAAAGRPIAGYRSPGATGSQTANLDGPGSTSGTWDYVLVEIVETAPPPSRKGWGVVR
jgi:hypothetical protein